MLGVNLSRTLCVCACVNECVRECVVASGFLPLVMAISSNILSWIRATLTSGDLNSSNR